VREQYRTALYCMYCTVLLLYWTGLYCTVSVQVSTCFVWCAPFAGSSGPPTLCSPPSKGGQGPAWAGSHSVASNALRQPGTTCATYHSQPGTACATYHSQPGTPPATNHFKQGPRRGCISGHTRGAPAGAALVRGHAVAGGEGTGEEWNGQSGLRAMRGRAHQARGAARC